MGAVVPHPRPMYSLKFVLHSPVAYPPLLSFLQRKWSSENALFCPEVWTRPRPSAASSTSRLPAGTHRRRRSKHPRPLRHTIQPCSASAAEERDM